MANGLYREDQRARFTLRSTSGQLSSVSAFYRHRQRQRFSAIDTISRVSSTSRSHIAVFAKPFTNTETKSFIFAMTSTSSIDDIVATMKDLSLSVPTDGCSETNKVSSLSVRCCRHLHGIALLAYPPLRSAADTYSADRRESIFSLCPTNFCMTSRYTCILPTRSARLPTSDCAPSDFKALPMS